MLIPIRSLLYCFVLLLCTLVVQAQHKPDKSPRFSVLVLAENGGHHIDYTNAAMPWLSRLAADSNFNITYIRHADVITESLLSRFQLFIQLDYPPYGWPAAAASAFEQYIATGKGGWIGFHHASLLGTFDGYPMWDWFSTFMGGIRYKNYIPGFVSATVHVEDRTHPCMKGIPDSFRIDKDEFYTYDKSPRPNVKVIAHVDESSYTPSSAITMGDHPVIWSNPHVPGRNVYIFMGHSPDLFMNKVYTSIFRNAIFWAAEHD